MNKDDVVKVLAAYSPPLSSAQLEEASKKIAEMAAIEESPRKEESTRKSRR